MKNLRLRAVVVALLFCAGLGTVRANVITGQLWHVSEAASQNAIQANVPATTPDVKFDVNSPLNFSGSGVSVGTWLASSSAFNISENTAGTLASLMDDGTNTQGTIVQFTGFVSVVNGQTFTVAHDDGLTLIIGATNLGFNPGPTPPTVSTATYGGPSGDFAFTLVYGECCGGPAVLQVDLPFSNTPAVPLPSSAWMGMGLLASLAVGARFRRRMRIAA